MGGNKVESIETIRYEREIIDLYIRHKSIDLVREFLSRKYSDRVWDSVNLRQIIIKAFRTSLQKIEKRRR